MKAFGNTNDFQMLFIHCFHTKLLVEHLHIKYLQN